MPVVFVYNCSLAGEPYLFCLSDVFAGLPYQCTSPCYQLYILDRECDNSEGLRSRSSVCILVAEAEKTWAPMFNQAPVQRVFMNCVITIIDNAKMPPFGERRNVLTISWGDARRNVLECLLRCTQVRMPNQCKLSRLRARLAEGVLRREISGLSPLVSTLSAPLSPSAVQPGVQWHGLLVGRWVADPLASILKQLFSGMKIRGFCRCSLKQAMPLPIWFTLCQYDIYEDAHAEVGEEAGVFSHVLFTLCLELLVGTQLDEVNIVMICLVDSVVEELAMFFRWVLPKAMEHLRMACGLLVYPEKYHRFNFDALVESGMLQLVGPSFIGEVSCRVTFWIGIRRRSRIDSWSCLIGKWNVLNAHCTRASDRLYLFFEDWCEGIVEEASGTLHGTGPVRGVRLRTRRLGNFENALARRRHFLVDLRRVSNDIWWNQDLAPKATYVVKGGSIAEIPAVVTCGVVRDALNLRFSRSRDANSFLSACAWWYSRRDGVFLRV